MDKTNAVKAKVDNNYTNIQSLLLNCGHEMILVRKTDESTGLYRTKRITNLKLWHTNLCAKIMCGRTSLKLYGAIVDHSSHNGPTTYHNRVNDHFLTITSPFQTTAISSLFTPSNDFNTLIRLHLNQSWRPFSSTSVKQPTLV